MRTQFTPALMARAVRDFGHRLQRGGVAPSADQLVEACLPLPAATNRATLLAAVDAAVGVLAVADKAPARQLVMEAAAAFFGLRNWDALAAAMPKTPHTAPAPLPAGPLDPAVWLEAGTSRPPAARPAFPSAYLVAEDWGHIFDDRRGEEHVRFCYDCTKQHMVAVQYRHSANRPWSPATPEQVADVLESLQGNHSLDPATYGNGAMDDPKEFGIDLVDRLPDWVAFHRPAPAGPNRPWRVVMAAADTHDFSGLDEDAAYDLAVAAIQQGYRGSLWRVLAITNLAADQPLQPGPVFGAEVAERASDTDPSGFIRFQATAVLEVMAPTRDAAIDQAREGLGQPTLSTRLAAVTDAEQRNPFIIR